MGSLAFNEDCMIGMKRFPNKYFELAIVDPPYGLDLIRGFEFKKKSRPNHRRNVLDGYIKYEMKDWDNAIPEEKYFKELFRVSENQIIWGGNYFTDFLYPSKGWIFWDKQFDKTYNFSHGELAWTSFVKQLLKFELSSKSETNGGKDKIHPTQKPKALYKWILKNYANEGDKILDTHLGSGSSRIAAYDMGFDFTGFELDKDYFEAQEKRFKENTCQLKLNLM